jgi:hypothetical protein
MRPGNDVRQPAALPLELQSALRQFPRLILRDTDPLSRNTRLHLPERFFIHRPRKHGIGGIERIDAVRSRPRTSIANLRTPSIKAIFAFKSSPKPLP